MQLVDSSFDWLLDAPKPDDLIVVEIAGRTCYKSESELTAESAAEFVRARIKQGHEAVLEHLSYSVMFVCDRGVSHEIVRHRLASYCQESTRYCNYSKAGEVTLIRPSFLVEGTPEHTAWSFAMRGAEFAYMAMLKVGCSPQQARSVLPNSLKTEVVMTANIREWRHFLRLRTSPAAHPQMRELVVPLLKEFRELLPAAFEDIPMPERRKVI